MLKITEAAGDFLGRLLAAAPEHLALRYVFSGSGVAPQLDSKRAGDTCIRHNGRVVLLLEPEVARWLADKTLDLQETSQGPGLAFRDSGPKPIRLLRRGAG